VANSWRLMALAAWGLLACAPDVDTGRRCLACDDAGSGLTAATSARAGGPDNPGPGLAAAGSRSMPGPGNDELEGPSKSRKRRRCSVRQVPPA
jgi:hypothetical protein